MPSALLIAIGGGALSALGYLSILTGSMGAIILAYLAPMPLFLVALSAGVKGGLIAAGVGTVIVALAGGAIPTTMYVVATALPVIILARQALLSRPDASGGMEWYPPGLTIVWLTGIGLAVLFAGALLSSSVDGGFRAVVERGLDRTVGEMARSSGAGTAESGEILHMMAAVLPGVVIVSWQIMTVINGSLAQGVLMRFGRNLRPPMRMAEIDLPSWVAIALAIAGVGGLLLPGNLGYVALNAAIVLGVPFFFAGLAVVHAAAAKRGGRGFLLVLFYLVLFMFGWPAIGVVGLGVIEQWAGLRRRLTDSGPDRE